MAEPDREPGALLRVDARTVLVTGQPLDLAGGRPDIANAVVHRTGDLLVLVDTGVTTRFRAALLAATEQVGAWSRLLVLTTHGHPDHVGNNDVADELAQTRRVPAEHWLPAADVEQIREPEGYWVGAFRRVAGFAGLPVPPTLAAIKVVSLFTPYAPFARVSRRYEERPLEQVTIGTQTLPGWSFAGGAVQVLRTSGHCAGQVVVYLRDSRLLHLSDELNGPCPVMPDADQLKISRSHAVARQLIDDGTVRVVTDGHSFAVAKAAEAAGRLDTLLAQAYAVQAATATELAGRDEVAAGEFVAWFGNLLQAQQVGGANPNQVFTAMMAVGQLELLGFRPSRFHHSHWRRAELASRHQRPPVEPPTERLSDEQPQQCGDDDGDHEDDQHPGPQQ